MAREVLLAAATIVDLEEDIRRTRDPAASIQASQLSTLLQQLPSSALATVMPVLSAMRHLDGEARSKLNQYAVTMLQIGEANPFPVTAAKLRAFIVTNIGVKQHKAHEQGNYISRLKGAVMAAELGWTVSDSDYSTIWGEIRSLTVSIPTTRDTKDPIPFDYLWKLYKLYKPWDGLQQWTHLIVSVTMMARGTESTDGHLLLQDITDMLPGPLHPGGYEVKLELRKPAKGVLKAIEPGFMFNSILAPYIWLSGAYWLRLYMQACGLQSRRASQPTFVLFGELVNTGAGTWIATNRPITRASAETALKRDLGALGMPADKVDRISLHSPRSTGKTLLMALLVSELIVNRLGAWTPPPGSAVLYDRSFFAAHLAVSAGFQRGHTIGLAHDGTEGTPRLFYPQPVPTAAMAAPVGAACWTAPPTGLTAGHQPAAPLRDVGHHERPWEQFVGRWAR